jgi:hypothetical protein
MEESYCSSVYFLIGYVLTFVNTCLYVNKLITLGLISRPSAKMLSLAQHPDYAQHLSVYAVSCQINSIKTFVCIYNVNIEEKNRDIEVENLTKCYKKGS